MILHKTFTSRFTVIIRQLKISDIPKLFWNFNCLVPQLTLTSVSLLKDTYREMQPMDPDCTFLTPRASLHYLLDPLQKLEQPLVIFNIHNGFNMIMACPNQINSTQGESSKGWEARMGFTLFWWIKKKMVPAKEIMKPLSAEGLN